MFDVDEWQQNQRGHFRYAARCADRSGRRAAEPDQRMPARLDLARFYMARGLYPEAKAVLDTGAWRTPGKARTNPVALIVHAVASILMGRPAGG